MRPIKIAFSGTSCTGKTTLIESLKQSYASDPSVVFVDEAARQYFKKHSMTVDFSLDTQKGIQELAMANEIKALETRPRVILSDRSVMDPAGYAYSLLSEATGVELADMVEDWISTYSKFYFPDPNDVVFVQDDIRTEESETRDRLYQGFIELFELKNIAYEILSGTTEERVKKVKADLLSLDQ